tara:strand:- start:692 stop:952 length:261 start_codon:yes stop_codon:yes gene_type:complete
MKLFDDERLMKNMNRAVAIMGQAMRDSGHVFTVKDRGFGVQDVMALFIKVPNIFPEPLHAEVKEFYEAFCKEVFENMKEKIKNEKA